MYLHSCQPCPTPLRIVSLIPSITELLVDLGMEKELIGITKFCVHPSYLRSQKPRIGGTKAINMERIAELNPTLIIANKEENVKEQVDQLAANYPVWLTDITSFEDAYQMINDIGILCLCHSPAQHLIADIKNAFSKLEHLRRASLPAAYLIWRDPYMTVGNDTFINNMLEMAGYRNVFNDQSRYPVIDIPDILRANCDTLFLSSEPYPFKAQHQYEIGQLLPGVKVVLVDGEMFSWYGSRLLKFPAYILHLLHHNR